MMTTNETKKKPALMTVADIDRALVAVKAEVEAASDDQLGSLKSRELGLQAARERALKREEEEHERSGEEEGRETERRHVVEAEAFSLERLAEFKAAAVAEAVELEAKLDALFVRIEDAEDAARVAKERMADEAAKAGVKAPHVPLWSGIHLEIGSAIREAHRARTPSTAGLSPHLAHIKASQIPVRAERARDMLQPRYR